MITLTPAQQRLQALGRDFARSVIRPAAAAVDEAERFPEEIVAAAARAGILAFCVPEEYGGGGVTAALDACLLIEELCWGCLGIGNLVTSNGFGVAPLLELGTPEQKARFLPRLCDPDHPRLTAVSVTEPDAGSDAASLKTRAEKLGDRYVLTGRKAFTSNAGVADWYVVFATTRPDLPYAERHRGITAFIVEAGTPGLRFGRPLRKMGQRAIPVAEIFLDGVEVPAENRLGAEGEGFAGLMRVFDRARVSLGAACVGLARAALEYARDYALERRQFGKPIAHHQAVAFKLADMATGIDAARLLVWRAALLADAADAARARGEAPRPFTREAAMAKLFASETAFRAAHQAQQVLGGYGYIRDYPVEKWLRDARLEEIEEGTSEIQRLVIARQVLGREARPGREGGG